MADEKLNTGQEENPQPSLFDAGPEGAPVPDETPIDEGILNYDDLDDPDAFV